MKYLITFILLCVVSIVEASSTPDWVLGRGHPSYDSTRYLVGVGHSDKGVVSANESARAELIKSISVRVNTVTNDYNSTDKSFSEASVSSETDFLLEGSKVKDGWYDEDKQIFYSLVVIERQNVLKTLQTMIDVLVDKNDLTLRQGDTFFNNGNIIKALVYYYDGYVESTKLFPYIRTYHNVILDSNKDFSEQDYNLIFKERIDSIVDNLNIEAVEKRVQNDEFSFTVRAKLNKTPVANFPIKFYSVYKYYVDRQVCSEDGCSTEVSVFDIINDKHSLYFRAVVDIKTLEKYFSYRLDRKIFNKLKMVSVSYKKKLAVNEVRGIETSITQDTPLTWGQKYDIRKQRIFDQMDRTVRMGRGGINLHIGFGNGRTRGNININRGW
tara:strand:- start:1725 stop:2873 length:1149 start_codon:yes stop_codon:yes gene_type:complete